MVFRLSTTGSEFSILHSFNGQDGENPEGALIVGADGNLYGTTLQGVVSFHDVAKAVYEEQSFENRMLKNYIKDWPEESPV